MIRFLAALALALLIGAPALAAEPMADLCADPRMARHVNPWWDAKRGCFSESILYRTAEGTIGTTRARVHDGWNTDTDNVYPSYLHYILVPGEGIIPLGAFKQEHVLAEIPILAQLGFDTNLLGGLTGAARMGLYDKLIERKGAAYCAVFRMKPPFEGELHSCGDGLAGQVRHSANAVPAKSAVARLCQLLELDGSACKGMVLEAFARDPDGGFSYVIKRWVATGVVSKLTKQVGNIIYSGDEQEFQRYRLKLDGSALVLSERARVMCFERCEEPKQ